MNRILFFCSAAFICSASINAQTTPAVYPGQAFRCFSPDGKWAAIDAGDSNPFEILDFSSDKTYTYNETYSGGAGNFISNNGIYVGRNMATETASYWSNGTWKELPVSPDVSMSFANGITSDGTRIVGNITPEGYTGDFEGTMVVPCYWDINPDGTVSQPVILPHPTIDFTNRPAQYVTAVCVSANGNIIAGQMTDYKGYVNQPVVYSCNEQGEWSYFLPVESLFYPEGYQLPDNPGEPPSQYDFMTPEEIAKFEADLKHWEETAGDDYDTYPNIDTYMSPQEYAAYAKAAMQWNIDLENYDIAINRLLAAVPNFTFNNIFLSSDGKFIASTDAKFFSDELNDIYIKDFVPYIIDVNNDTYKKYPAVNDINIMLSSLCDDGTMLGQWSDTDYGIFNGYILTPGADEFIPLAEYVKGIDPALYKWMEENMTQTYTWYDPNTLKGYPRSILATGIPFATPDMSLIGFAQNNFWNYPAGAPYYGYLISLPPLAGAVESLTSDEGNLQFAYDKAAALLTIMGDFQSVDVYYLDGVKAAVEVKSDGGNAVVNLSHLGKGMVIVSAVDASGHRKSTKLPL